jgi:UDP-N-acetylglucosamine acyltransferase
MPIHPTAIIDKTAEVDTAAEIGAYAVVEAGVQLAADVRLYPHAFVGNGTTLERGVEVHPFAVVGHLPQDLSFKGGPTYTVVGAETVIREHAQVHRGALPDSTTHVGARCYVMATGHIAHNCIVSDDVIIASGALLAGHVEVDAGAFISGNAAIHQFVHVGRKVMIGGGTRITQDVPPFLTITQDGAIGPNAIGLRRAGFDAASRAEIRHLYRAIFRSGRPFRDALEAVAATAETDAGREFIEYLQRPTKRGFTTYRPHGAHFATSQDES